MGRGRVVLALSVTAVGGLFAPDPIVAQTVEPANLRVEVVAQLFATPTSMTFIGPDDLLVLLTGTGRVRRVTGGVPGPFVLDVNVEFHTPQGFLGITKDPDFVHNGYIYIFYTESEGFDGGPAIANRVYRYRWDGSVLAEPLLVLDLPLSIGGNHHGGVIMFGRDDRLYTIVGDLNHLGQLQNFPEGPPPDDGGVILRTDGRGRALTDNPFYDPDDPRNPLGRYWAYGVRNSFGLAVDPVSGDVWDTENGPLDMDEVNRVVRGSNSGWRKIMGPDERSPGSQSDLWHAPGSVYSDPEFSWVNPIGPTALQFVASRRLGCDLEHRLIVGDVNCDQLYRFGLDPARNALAFDDPALSDLVADNLADRCAGEQSEIRFGSGFGVATDIENGPDGFLYVVSFTRNTIYRIRPVEPVAGDSDADLVPDACDCAPADPQSWAEPREVPRIRLSGTGDLRLGWDEQSPTGGPGTTFDLASGSLLALRADASFVGACSLGSSPTTTWTDSRPAPEAGDAYYYLVRSANGCGQGTFGDGSGPADPRDLLDTLSHAACD